MIYNLILFVTWFFLLLMATAAWFGWYEFLKWVVR
jgi:hypothetical protein